MPKPAILLISYHFYPSNLIGAKRPSETAYYLAERGYNVTVIRAVDRIQDNNSEWPGFGSIRMISVRIPRKILTTWWMKLKSIVHGTERTSMLIGTASSHDIEESNSNRQNAFQWLRRQIVAFDTLFEGEKIWIVKTLGHILLLRHKHEYDFVMSSGPPLASHVCAFIASKILDVPLVLDFRDPWYLHVDKERRSNMFGHPLANWEDSIAQKCVSRSSLMVVASPGARRHIEESFDVDNGRIKLVRNGFDDAACITDPPPNRCLKLLFTGSIYFNRNPFPFLEALGQVSRRTEVDRTVIKFTMIGHCEEWGGEPIQPWLERNDMQDIVRIMLPVNSNELREMIKNSNVLVNFAQGQPRQIPAKSYEYLAARRDTIVLTEENGDVAALYREAGIGHIVNSEDVEAMTAAILSMYEKYVDPGLSPCPDSIDIAPFSRRVQLERLERHLRSVLGSQLSAD